MSVYCDADFWPSNSIEGYWWGINVATDIQTCDKKSEECARVKNETENEIQMCLDRAKVIYQCSFSFRNAADMSMSWNER